MSVIAVTSTRSSPGATTLAVGIALAWRHLAERSLLIEADPAGGVLGLRFGLGATPSLTTFGSDTRNEFTPESLWANTQELRGASCMPGPVDPRLAASWTQRVAPTLAHELPRIDAPTVVDLGRLDGDPVHGPLIEAADLVLVVTSPEVAEVQSLLFGIHRIQALGGTAALVCVGDRPHDPNEVAAVAGIPLLAVVPDDPTLAVALAGGEFPQRKFRRSLLWRTIYGLAGSLLDVAPVPVVDAPAVVAEPARPAVMLAASEPPVDVALPAADTEDPHIAEPAIADHASTVETAWLIDGGGARTPLDAARPIVLGRRSDCDVVIADELVSRRHGEIQACDDGFVFVDLGSSNGSRINGERMTRRALTPGDEIRLGSTSLRFESHPSTPTDTPSTRELEFA